MVPLLIALFLIYSQLLATSILCFHKHLLSNDPENNFIPCLQSIPEVPHLPESNQLVGGVDECGCVYLPTGDCWSQVTTCAADIPSPHPTGAAPLGKSPAPHY